MPRSTGHRTTLSDVDPNGNTLQQVVHCAETARTRLSRDLFFYTKDGKFLVTRWNTDGHRANVKYGNAFGTFYYKTAKTGTQIPKIDLKFFYAKWERKLEGWMLMLKNKAGLGAKNDLLESVFGKEKAGEYIANANGVQDAHLYVMKTDKDSMLKAPMTILATFILVNTENAKLFNTELSWLSLKDALDPSKNLHAGVIAAALENGPLKGIKSAAEPKESAAEPKDRLCDPLPLDRIPVKLDDMYRAIANALQSETRY